MNIFKRLIQRCDKLNKKGQAYLDTLPFLPNQEVMDRLWAKASEIFQSHNEDWSKIPEWVSLTMDGWMPYGHVPKNGSIHFTLGYAMVAQDANLRNLLEIAEGRETKKLKLSCLAKLD